MGDLLLVADQRSAIKEIFGDLITSFDARLPAYEAAEQAYEGAKQDLRDQMKRLHEGLKRLDEADSPERLQKIQSRMMDIAREDIPEAFATFVATFLDLVLKYGEK